MKNSLSSGRLEELLRLRRKVDVRIPGKLPWREAGPPNHHDDNVDSDQ